MQGRFSQDVMPLENREVALAEVAALPIPAGERAVLHWLGLAHLDAQAQPGGRVFVSRAQLAEAVKRNKAHVGRVANRLVSRGLAVREPLGREATWAIVWSGVWSPGPQAFAPPAAGRRSGARPEAGRSQEAEADARSRTPALAEPVVHTGARLPVGRGSVGAGSVGVVLAAVAWCLVWPLAAVGRRACACERSLSRRIRAHRARARTGGVRTSEPVREARPNRVARVQLALPFRRETAETARGTCAQEERTGALVGAQTGQLGQPLAKEQPAACGGRWVNKKDLETADGNRRIFERARLHGWVGAEAEWFEFVAFIHAVKRRSSGRLAAGEKEIKSPAGYVARVVEMGSWQDDVKREDREWVQEQRQKSMAVVT